jgi:hypothetical protein
MSEAVMTETATEAELKRVKNELGNMQQQLQFLKQHSMGVGHTFAGMVRELLLALADPADTDQVNRAKKHAKELLRQWDLSTEQQGQPAPRPAENGAA